MWGTPYPLTDEPTGLNPMGLGMVIFGVGQMAYPCTVP